MRFSLRTMQSPVGMLTLVAADNSLAAILWENDDPKRVRLPPLLENTEDPVLSETERKLQEYFGGVRKAFDLPLYFSGTAFQQKVWNSLLNIPYGETRSYSEIAKDIGCPNAIRAVGAANGKNPISIIAPCHRVIGASGKLTGFAGGINNKSYLLSLESGQKSLI